MLTGTGTSPTRKASVMEGCFPNTSIAGFSNCQMTLIRREVLGATVRHCFAPNPGRRPSRVFAPKRSSAVSRRIGSVERLVTSNSGITYWLPQKPARCEILILKPSNSFSQTKSSLAVGQFTGRYSKPGSQAQRNNRIVQHHRGDLSRRQAACMACFTPLLSRWLDIYEEPLDKLKAALEVSRLK